MEDVKKEQSMPVDTCGIDQAQNGEVHIAFEHSLSAYLRAGFSALLENSDGGFDEDKNLVTDENVDSFLQAAIRRNASFAMPASGLNSPAKLLLSAYNEVVKEEIMRYVETINKNTPAGCEPIDAEDYWSVKIERRVLCHFGIFLGGVAISVLRESTADSTQSTVNSVQTAISGDIIRNNTADKS